MLFSPPERIFSFVYYEVKMNYLEHKTPSNTIALHFEPTTRTNRLFVYIFLTQPEFIKSNLYDGIESNKNQFFIFSE